LQVGAILSPSQEVLVQFRLLAVSLAAAIVAVGCKDATAPAPTLSGPWRGALSSSSLRISLTQSGSQVAGNGSVTIGATSYALTIEGNIHSRRFSLSFDNPTLEPFIFTGDLSADGMWLEGQVNGSGFVAQPVTLVRDD
jgi:hypothetical protein